MHALLTDPTACLQAVVDPYTSQCGTPGAASGLCKRHHWRLCCAPGLRLVRLDLRGLGRHHAHRHPADHLRPHESNGGGSRV